MLGSLVTLGVALIIILQPDVVSPSQVGLVISQSLMVTQVGLQKSKQGFALFKCTKLKTKERTSLKSIAIALKGILMKKSLSHNIEQDLEKASWYLANLVRKKYDKRKHRNDIGRTVLQHGFSP